MASGCLLRMALSLAMNGASDCGWSHLRGRSWYFSESRYSSLPSRSGMFSPSSYPLYMPHDGQVIAASTARSLNAGSPPRCSVACRMSGVFTQKLGRNQSASSVCDNSCRYSLSSHFELRHVKYVYDCVNPSFASRCITAGRVNASARKSTSGWRAWMSRISHSQKRSGFVCGLSTRKRRTPRAIQKSITSRSAAHSASLSSVSKSNG